MPIIPEQDYLQKTELLNQLNALRAKRGAEPLGFPSDIQPSAIETSRGVAFPSVGGMAIKLAENLWGPKPTEDQARQSVIAHKGLMSLPYSVFPGMQSPTMAAIQPQNTRESLVSGGMTVAGYLPALMGGEAVAGMALAPGLGRSMLTGGLIGGVREGLSQIPARIDSAKQVMQGDMGQIIPALVGDPGAVLGATAKEGGIFGLLHGAGAVGKTVLGEAGAGIGKLASLGKTPEGKLIGQEMGRRIGATAGRVLGSGAGMGGLTAVQGAPQHEVIAQTGLGLAMGALGGVEKNALLKVLSKPTDTYLSELVKTKTLPYYRDALFSKKPGEYIWSPGEQRAVEKSTLTPAIVRQLAVADGLFQQKLWMDQMYKTALGAGVHPGGQVSRDDANRYLYDVAKEETVRLNPTLKGYELEFATAKQLNNMIGMAKDSNPADVFGKNGDLLSQETTAYLQQRTLAQAATPFAPSPLEEIGKLPKGYTKGIWDSIVQLGKDNLDASQSTTFQGAFAFLRQLPGVFREIPHQTLETQVKYKLEGTQRKKGIWKEITTKYPNLVGVRHHLAFGTGLDPRQMQRFTDWYVKENEPYHKKYPQALRRLEKKPIQANEDLMFRDIRDNYLTPEFNKLLDEVNKVMVNLGLDPLGKEANYLPFYEDFRNALDLFWYSPAHPLEFMKMVGEIRDAQKLPQTWKEGADDLPRRLATQADLKHKSKYKPPQYLAHPLRAMGRYIDDVARFKFINEELPKYNEVTKRLHETSDLLAMPTEKLSPDKQLLQQELLRKGVDIGHIEKLSNYFSNANNMLADIPTAESLLFQQSGVLKTLQQMSNKVFGQMVTTIPTALKQGYALVALAPQVGMYPTAKRFLNEAMPWNWEKFSTTARKVAEGTFDRIHQKSRVVNARVSSHVDTPLDTEINLGHRLLSGMVSSADAMLVKTSFVEGYYHYLKNAPESFDPMVREQKAIEYGDSMAARINGVYEKWAKPSLLQAILPKLVQPFQTAVLSEAESLYDTFARARPEFILDKNAPLKEVRAKKIDALAVMLATSFFVNEGIRFMTNPRDSEESLGSSYVKGLLQHVPFYSIASRGEMGTSFMRPWARFINTPSKETFAEAISPWFPQGTYQLQRTMQGTKAVFTGEIKTRMKDGVMQTTTFDPMSPMDIFRALAMSPKKTQIYQEYAKNSYFSEDPIIRMMEKVLVKD